MRRIFWSKSFQRAFDKALKKYPASTDTTRNSIDALAENPSQGDIYPGIVPESRKLRLPLKAYNIGKSDGLRCIITVLPEEVIPVFVYKKSTLKEHEVVALVKQHLREILLERASSTE